MAAPQLEQDIIAYIAGEAEAGGRICRNLEPILRAEAKRFLPAGDPELDDVVQESLLALLAYLRRAENPPNRPEAFAATIARNRCRNLYQWRKRRRAVDLDTAGPIPARVEENPLEALERAERHALLKEAFARLDEPCRRLLLSVFVESRPMEELQRKAGLGTLQGIYYRKQACLKRLNQLLNRSWFGGRDSGP